MDVVNIEGAKKLLRYSMESNQPIGFCAPPGVGKSAVVGDYAEQLGLPLECLLLSLCDPTDLGGFPVSNGKGSLDRLPLGSIKRACNEPVVLFLDELSCAAPAVQAAALQLIYARRAGDVVLHPGTRIVAAFNPPEQAAGGWDLALPLIGRMTMVRMQPTVREVQEYFFKLGKEGSTLRSLAIDWAATLEADAALLHLNPPAGSQQSGRPWGAPRSWERALRLCAAAIDAGESDVSDLFGASLAGNVGDEAATSYMALRKLRHNLPKMKDIIEKPEDAKLPSDTNGGIAVLGILAQVAIDEPCAAWIYAERLSNEPRVAAARVLSRRELALPRHKGKCKMYETADLKQTKVLKSIGNLLKG